MMTRFSHRFPRYLPPPSVGLLWIASVGMLDWLTGSELSLSAFYLPGIALVAWFSGRWPSVVMAFCAGATWLLAELSFDLTYSSPVIPYWNATVRLMFFLITALLTAEVRTRQRTEAALREHDNILGSILNSMGDGVIVVGGDDRILVFNPAAEKLLGANAAGKDARRWAAEMDALQADVIGRENERPGPLSLAVKGKGPAMAEFPVHLDVDEESLILGLTVLPLLAYENESSGVVMVIANLTAKRNLEKKIAAASEREQRRIGRDLHDGVCQHLVGVAFAAGTLQSSLEDVPLPREAEAAGEIAALINDAITEARNLAHGLYPASLNEGIGMALMSLAGTTKTRTGILTEASIADPLPHPDPETSTHLYRIAQEGVSNACRHGAPKHIRLSLNSTGDQLKLVVEDDGRGFDSSNNSSGGIGLNLMRHRAALLGGTLEIETDPGQGTRVICILPANQTQTSTA